MKDSTLFYVLGGCLAVLAVLASLVGVRVSRFPASRAVMVATIAIFVALVGGTITFAVLNGQDEEEARATELEKAGEEVEAAEENPASAGESAEIGKAGGAPQGAAPVKKAKGPGGTVQLAASPTEIAFDTKELSSKPGKVTIEFTNPATLEHDVAIEQDGKQIAVSETIGKGKTSVSADLAPGDYTFLCTVPGHAEAGMEGTLTVK